MEQKDTLQAAFEDEFVVVAPQPAIETPKKEEPPKETPPQKVRREIDLGDGSGVQVFEADTLDQLADKLAEAQKNATKKIREQNRLLKARRASRPAESAEGVVEPTLPPPLKLTREEFFVANQKASEGDVEAQDALYRATPTYHKQYEQHVQDLTREQQAKAASEFVFAHQQNYLPTPQNSALLEEYLEAHDLPMTRANLDLAFDELDSSGLLEKPKKQETPRIETPPASEKKPASTGLSDKESTPPAALTDQGALTEQELAELYALPVDEMLTRIRDRLYLARKAGSR